MSTPPPSGEQPTFAHSGRRYLLGHTSAEYGIWDRQAPGPPVEKFAKTEQGWSQAWARYQSLESTAAAPVPVTGVAATTPPSIAAQGPTPTAQPVVSPGAPGARPSLNVRPATLAQVLTVAGWTLLVLLPLSAIAALTVGNPGFPGITNAFANMALGVGLWAMCLTLARVARRDG